MFKISIALLLVFMSNFIVSNFTHADSQSNIDRETEVKLLRIRPMLESLNYSIEWNEDNRTVLVTKNNHNILLSYTDNSVSIDSNYKTTIPMYLINNSLFLKSNDFEKIFNQGNVSNFIEKIGITGIMKIPAIDSPILVAVLDSGINLHDSELVSYITQGTSILDEKSSYNDEAGHGTNVVGIIVNIAQYTSNPSNIKVIPIKVLDTKASGKKEDLIKGIYYAIENGAKIICLALGTTVDSSDLSMAIEYAEQHNVTIIAATGNNNSSVDFPACYPTVIGVGAIDENGGRRAPLSNSGHGIDLVAENLTYTSDIHSRYSFSSGTSMAAAQVAAGVAVLISKSPDLKPYQIRSLLRNTAKPIKDIGWNNETGYGLLNIEALLSIDSIDALKTLNKQSLSIDNGKTVYALLGQNNTKNSYLLNFQSEGTLEINIEFNNLKFNESKPIKINLLRENKIEASFLQSKAKGIKLSVKKGIYQLDLNLMDENIENLEYKLTPNFSYNDDKYEGNDSIESAYSLDTTNLIKEKKSVIQIITSVIDSKLNPIICFYDENGTFTEINLGKVSEPEILNKKVSSGLFYFAIKAGTSSLGAYTLQFKYDNLTSQDILLPE